MGSRSANELLQLPVNLHGIRLGQPTDLLLDLEDWRALGLVVLCGDDAERFLVLPAGTLGEEEIAVGSALLLLEDVDFYRERSRSFRALRGSEVEGGALDDLAVAADGTVTPLVADGDGASA
jgi:hypothetical protein